MLTRLARSTLISLVLSMALVALAAVAACITFLYRAAYREQRLALEGSAASLASMLEAVAEFDVRHSAGDDPGGSFGATMGQLERGLGAQRFSRPSEELTIGQRDGGRIRLARLSRDSGGIESIGDLPLQGRVAEPMQRALRGESGSAQLHDYQGRLVLAGYAPIPTLGVGLVHKIDLREVQAPFRRAAALAALVAVLVILFGTLAFGRFAAPLRRAVDASQQLLQRHSNVLLSMAEGVSFSDPAGKIIFANPALERMFGYAPGEMEGLAAASLSDEASPETQGSLARMREALASEGHWLGELRSRRKDQSTFYTRTRVSTLDGGGETYLISVQEDISLEREALARERASLSLLRAVVDSSPDLIFIKDLEFRFLLANEALAGSMGRQVDEIVGRPDTDFFSREDCEGDPASGQRGFHDDDRRAFAGEVVHNPDDIVTLPDGAVLVFDTYKLPLYDPAGRVYGVLGYSRDITLTRRAELELAASSAYLKTIVENEPECVKLLDPDGRLLDMNPAGLAMIEADSLAQVQDACIYDVLALQHRGAFREMVAAVFAGEKRTLTFEVLGLKGARRWLETHSVPLRNPADGSVRALLGVTRDITEKVRAEAELKKERDFATGLVETAPVVVLVVDPEGRIQYVNPYFEQLSGFSLEEVRGKDWFGTMLPARDQERIRQLFRRALELETLKGIINPIVTRSGEERMLEWSDQFMRGPQGEITALLAIGLDTTDRVQAEQAVQQSLLRLEEAQRIAKLGSWELDLLQNRLSWSEEIYRLFEIDPQQFGASYEAFLEAVHPEDRARVDAAYQQSLASQTPYSIVHRLRLPDGRVKHVREECETQYDAAGRPLRSVGTVQDISAEVLAAQRLEQQLAEKELLLREVHHRVKNNLQIISSLFYLQASTAGDQGLKELLRDSQNRIEAMVHLHETLYQREDFSSIDFREYADLLCKYLLQSFGADSTRIQLEIQGDGTQLDLNRAVTCGLIINEAVSNSLKHAFPAGRAGKIAVGYSRRADGWLELSVADNGIGLPQDGTPLRDGALGLRLIERLAGQLGGKVEQGGGPGVVYRIAFPGTGA